MATKPQVVLLKKNAVTLLIMLALLNSPNSVLLGARQSAGPGDLADKPLNGEIESFAGLQGQWVCEGVFPSGGKRINSTILFTPNLEGMWLSVRQDDLPPNKFHAVEYWGFDSPEKQFVAFVFDNFGGVRKFTSSGWARDRFIWLGEASKTSPLTVQRFVYKRHSPNQLLVSWEVKKGTSDWAVGDTLTCKR